MHNKETHTENTPSKPLLIWDGACGFCKYWITVWKKHTKGKVLYKPYQEVADDFSDIPREQFKKASQFIETDGRIYSGPDSAYKSITYYRSSIKTPHRWYHSSGLFRTLSDKAYVFIAKNRPLMMKVTKVLWGDDPKSQKPYWAIWLFIIMLVFILLLMF